MRIWHRLNSPVSYPQMEQDLKAGSLKCQFLRRLLTITKNFNPNSANIGRLAGSNWFPLLTGWLQKSTFLGKFFRLLSCIGIPCIHFSKSHQRAMRTTIAINKNRNLSVSYRACDCHNKSLTTAMKNTQTQFFHRNEACRKAKGLRRLGSSQRFWDKMLYVGLPFRRNSNLPLTAFSFDSPNTSNMRGNTSLPLNSLFNSDSRLAMRPSQWEIRPKKLSVPHYWSREKQLNIYRFVKEHFGHWSVQVTSPISELDDPSATRLMISILTSTLNESDRKAYNPLLQIKI